MDALSRVIPKGTLVSTGSSGLAIEAFYTIFRIGFFTIETK